MEESKKKAPGDKKEKIEISTKSMIDLRQYFMSLKVKFDKIRKRGGDEDLAALIEQEFTREPTWERAYRIEQLLVGLYSDDELDFEMEMKYERVNRRLDQGKRSVFKKVYESELSRGKKEVLLVRMLRDLQFYQMDRFRTFNLFERIRLQRSTAFILVSVLFLGFFILKAFMAMGEMDTYMVDVIIYLLASCLGASFSLLISTRSVLENTDQELLTVVSNPFYIFARILTGLGAGIILIVIIESGLLQNLFKESLFSSTAPSSVKPGLPTIGYREIFLGVLMGFSEKLIPSILTRTEAKFYDDKKAPPSAALPGDPDCPREDCPIKE